MNTLGLEKTNRLKILFLIHDLGQGGAEKVLINLVNHLDTERFDISVISLFGGGVNEKFIRKEVRYHSVFPTMIPANSHLMKLLDPVQLHKMIVKEQYDIEISYLEGPSARVISGCTNKNTKLISWIHVEQHTMMKLSRSFRNEKEARECYSRFDQTIAVSEFVMNDFKSILGFSKPIRVLYNTVESDRIRQYAAESADEMDIRIFKLIAVGTLKQSKGYMRLLNVINRLKNDFRFRLYILGEGPLKSEMLEYIEKNGLKNYVELLGYQTNPYKYVAASDLFVCASFAEGFSTAVTESLIVGTPVCTVEVSGMKELLGGNSEYGLITENSEDALYEGIRKLMSNHDLLGHYAEMAKERGFAFSTKNTVKEVENMLTDVYGGKVTCQ